MILVDTSIWVDHVRRRNEILAGLLERDLILSHPFVIGELALAGLKPEVLGSLRKLPRAVAARDDEVMEMIERHCLAGRGIGYVDAHLLASARLTGDAKVWTTDRKLKAVAEELGLLPGVTH